MEKEAEEKKEAEKAAAAAAAAAAEKAEPEIAEIKILDEIPVEEAMDEDMVSQLCLIMFSKFLVIIRKLAYLLAK